MSACDVETLESLVVGELSASRAQQTLHHVKACAPCEATLRSLRDTRAALAGVHRRTPERTAHLFPAIAERTQARRTVRRQLAAVALTFASLTAVILLSLPAPEAGARHSVFPCARQCVEPDSCEGSTLDAVAQLEEQFAACLVATPVSLPEL